MSRTTCKDGVMYYISHIIQIATYSIIFKVRNRQDIIMTLY